MDIELKLREMFVLKDPGIRFTDDVLSRVGDVPAEHANDGVVRLSDARRSKRGRHLLLGALVVAAAAAVMLPFLPGRNGSDTTADAATLAAPGSELSDGDSAAAVSVVQSEPAMEGEEPLDCLDPDVLYGLLLPGQLRFRILPALPAELAAFQPPRELVWLGGTERGSAGVSQVSAVYRTNLDPDAARVAAVGALVASGWKRHTNDHFPTRNVFVSADFPAVSETYCREDRPLGVRTSALDGVTYVVLARTDAGAGINNACNQPPQQFARTPSPFDEHTPTLALPQDPATGQPAAMRGSTGGSSGNGSRRASASFALKGSAQGVASHFASQLAEQGWVADASWSGTAMAGSTWSRRLDDDTVLLGMLAISAFEADRFTTVFRMVLTK